MRSEPRGSGALQSKLQNMPPRASLRFLSRALCFSSSPALLWPDPSSGCMLPSTQAYHSRHSLAKREPIAVSCEQAARNSVPSAERDQGEVGQYTTRTRTRPTTCLYREEAYHVFCSVAFGLRVLPGGSICKWGQRYSSMKNIFHVDD